MINRVQYTIDDITVATVYGDRCLAIALPGHAFTELDKDMHCPPAGFRWGWASRDYGRHYVSLWHLCGEWARIED